MRIVTRRTLGWNLILAAVMLGPIGCGARPGSPIQPDDFVAESKNPADPQVRKRLQSDGGETSSAATNRPAPRARPEPKRPTSGGAAQPSPDRADVDSTPHPQSDTTTARTTPPSDANARPPQPAPDQPTFAVGAMVGQVNGQALYARTVLQPRHEQLQALARQHDRAGFRKRARAMIRKRLRGLVVDRLVLGEAMRDLSEREQRGLDMMVQQKREEILRRFGRGSLAVAEQAIREQTGRTLQQNLEGFRKQAVVQRYMKQKLYPKVSVSHQDVVNYYREHPEQYSTRVKRKIRLIRVASQSEAQHIARRLANGAAFKQLARREVNQFSPADGGLLGTQSGDDVLQGPLNEVLVDLKAGAYGGPVQFNGDHWFVYCEKLTRREGKPLREVQLQIRRQLRKQRLGRRSQQYQQQLLEQGSFEPIEAMTDRLVNIAVSRYAAPAGSTARADSN